MKTFILLFLFLLVSNSFASEQAHAELKPPAAIRYVIGISPFLDKSVKDDLYRRIITFVLDHMPLNSSLSIYDAYNIRSVTQIIVPDVRAFRSSKTRANQFKEPIQQLRQFVAATAERPTAPRLNLDQAVRFPQFMDFVGENLCKSKDPLVVMVLGSPLYLDAKEPGFSMIDGYFPSDGHLLASREQSVFGLKTRANALTNVTVHFGWFGDPWVSAVHQEKIARFWTLYLAGQGGTLATFCGDLPTLFNAVHAPRNLAENRASKFEIDPAEKKIEMLRITRDASMADWITRDNVTSGQQPPPSKTVGPMKIGIRWKGKSDLDLYASATPHSETLFFEHTRAPEGYYFKDHRSSPDREYEFIEFESPVDVFQVEAMINFYEGSAPGGPVGEVRVEFDGRIYSSRFNLAASKGNQGRSGNRQGDYWAAVDIPGILKLAPPRQILAIPEPH